MSQRSLGNVRKVRIHNAGLRPGFFSELKTNVQVVELWGKTSELPDLNRLAIRFEVLFLIDDDCVIAGHKPEKEKFSKSASLRHTPPFGGCRETMVAPPHQTLPTRQKNHAIDR